jgi:hypothetical protein
MIPPACLACGHSMESCDRTTRVHRACFGSWDGAAHYTRKRFDYALADAPRKSERGSACRRSSAVLHWTKVVACLLYVVASDERARRLDVTAHVWHVSALAPVFVPLRNWRPWVHAEEPVFGRSGHIDDLALYARELDGLRLAWPDAAAIRRSAVFAALKADVGCQSLPPAGATKPK